MCRVSATNQLAKCISTRKQTLRDTWLTPLEDVNTVTKAMELCDTMFCVTDCATEEVCLFPASRAMIASTSELFDRMLFGEMSEATKSDKTIAINGVTVEGFKFLLALCYGFDDELVLDKENCVEVLQAADYFCAQDLREACVEQLRELLVMQNDVDTTVHIIARCKVTHAYEIEPVKEIVETALARPSFVDDVLKSDAFNYCTPEIVFDIVSNSNNSIFLEEELWLKLVEWARFQYGQVGNDAAERFTRVMGTHDFDSDCHRNKEGSYDTEGNTVPFAEYKAIAFADSFDDFRDVLAPLLPFIRFPIMDPVFFSDVVIPLQVLGANVALSVFSLMVGSSIARTPFLCDERSSKILSFQEMKGIVQKAYPRDRTEPKIRQLYRGSIHGFSALKFHELCDNQGPTLTVVETQNGHIIGGYNEQSWKSSAEAYSEDNDTFLFIAQVQDAVQPQLGQYCSLPIIVRSPQRGYQNNVYDQSALGPTFCSGWSLYIADDCGSNADSYCSSPESKFSLNSSSINQVHTSWFVGNCDGNYSGRGHFQVKEYEVFSIE